MARDRRSRHTHEPAQPSVGPIYHRHGHADRQSQLTPLARKIPGLQRFEAGRVLAMPDGSAPPYYFIAELAFDDTEALQVGRGTAEGQATADDVANFATGGVTLMIVEA